MQAACDHCGAKHVLDDRQIAGSSRVKFRCSKCSQVTRVDVAADTNRTSISVRPDAEIFVEPTALSDQIGLALPAGKSIVLTVTEGRSQGQSFALDRPRIVIGRLGADFAIDDPDISRWHCVMEVCGEEVRLRDLDSRNGTFTRDERVRAAPLTHQAEFRIGNSRVRLAIQSA
ncbi:MAG: FHA domain-containing protein [Candidatus Acidiferrales bacterium]